MPKFILKVDVPVTVCVEVAARNKAEAAEKASLAAQELVPLYHGIGANIERPTMLDTDSEDDSVWFEIENVPYDFFDGPGVSIERK